MSLPKIKVSKSNKRKRTSLPSTSQVNLFARTSSLTFKAEKKVFIYKLDALKKDFKKFPFLFLIKPYTTLFQLSPTQDTPRGYSFLFKSLPDWLKKYYEKGNKT
jgi:hypothetical protein